MYSLYRAWLSMSQTQSLQESSSTSSSLPLNLSTPLSQGSGVPNAPDVQLQVGPSLTTFSAHRNVLSTHSGFFKAALLNQNPSGSPIIVPNIQVDEFSSLLTFMYTGYLDLNLGNIYNILLATHILHMPRALELCRSFLMQAQQQQQQTQQHTGVIPSSSCLSTEPQISSIIKPIASRNPLPNISYQNQDQEQEQQRLNLSFNSSVFKKFQTNVKDGDGGDDDEPSTSTCKEIKPKEKQQEKEQQPNKKDKIKVKEKEKQVKDPSKPKRQRQSGVVLTATATTTAAACVQDQDHRTIVDIACCDGPVRFHRVVNKNYGQAHGHRTSEMEMKEGKKRTTEAAINKVMTENILQASTSSTNPDTTTTSTVTTANATLTTTTDLYTCLYCNHTFKSQYCYQKHARRHLNPVDPVKVQVQLPTTIANTTGNAKRNEQGQESVAHQANHNNNNNNSNNSNNSNNGNKREFKLLDMNVQYYPCKTCGSKFPSYYFVHKHRKLCHAEEMADGSNKNNEIVQVKPKDSATSPAGAAGAGTAASATKKSRNDENSNGGDTTNELSEVIANDLANGTSNEESCHSDIIDVEETND